MTVIGKQKFQSGDEGIINFKSSNPFEFFHILNSKESEEPVSYTHLRALET